MTERQETDRERDVPKDVEPDVIEVPLEEVSPEDIDLDEELAQEQIFNTKHGGGHTQNPQQAAEQGLTYTPPTDPATVPSRDDPQGAEIAAGFAMSMEDADLDVEDLPAHVDDNDLDLQDNVADALRYNSETGHLGDISIHVSDGVVYLLGSVPDESDLTLVYDIAAGTAGVVRVVDHLRVGP